MEENVFVGIIRASRATTAESLIRSLEVNGQAAERLGPTVLTFCISCTFLDLSKCDSSREHLRLMRRDFEVYKIPEDNLKNSKI
jgi:hypothetical protein